MTTFLLLSRLVGQTGYWNDFSSGTTTGWGVGTGVSSSKFTINNLNQELVVNATATNYDNFEHVFSSINIGANPVLKIKVKSANAFTMRIDLTDANGKSTNAVLVENLITAGTTYKEYIFNYKGKFKNYGSAVVVDSTKITKISIFLNGGSNFTGLMYFDDLIIGDKIKTLPLQIRLNQIGYEAIGPKTAIVETDYAYTDTLSFGIYNASGQKVYGSIAGTSSLVSGWGIKYFRVLDFSSLNQAGTYTIRAAGNVSYPFEIGQNLYFKKTAGSCVSYFKNMRSTDIRDRDLNLFGSTKTANVYGGWWDATGDPGKHMSHLSYANYFNPQQIPLVAWSLLKSYELNTADYGIVGIDVTSEANWGADYLMKNIDAEGYLYLAVFDDWGGSINREICEWGKLGNNSFRTSDYKAAMREGAGTAIAALAKAYTMGIGSQLHTKESYLEGAQKLYRHLKSVGTGYNTKNIQYCNNHRENIIDLYCGLLAAVELYKATNENTYLNDANLYAFRLGKLQNSQGWFAADSTLDRPFYHASDEGLPIVALVEYAKAVPSQKAQIETIIKKWYNWYNAITREITNPFLYIREQNQSFNTITNTYGSKTNAFFVPRDNETGYWWQGENARLASMTTAANYAGSYIRNNYNFGTDSISSLAISQLDWIAGKNPFGVCMIYGFGSSTYPDYVPGGANKKPNVVGGICNGITGNSTNTALEFMPYNNTNTAVNWQNWRWVEQWLPHTAWWLLAVSTINNSINNPYYDCNKTFGGSAFLDSCGTCASGTTGKTAILDKSKCTVSATSDIELAAKTLVEMHPNPSNGLVTFTFNTTTEYPMEVLIMDNTGKTLIAKTIPENNTTFKTNELKNGLYNVNIKTRNGVIFTKKLSVIN